MSIEVKEGLETFCRMWKSLAPTISGSDRAIAPALFHKRINCRIRGSEGFLLDITPEDASLRAGEDRWAHATIELDRDDWLRSMSGECNLRSISMAGRFACDMEQLKVVSVFGMILQSFALLNRG